MEKTLSSSMTKYMNASVYGHARHHQILNLCPEAKDLTIIVNGVSKAFAMTGWRIGYALGPTEIIATMGSFQGHLTSNACSVAQWAAVGALREANNDVIAMHSQFSKRKDLAVSLLKDMPLITFQEPQGAFYVWINIEKTFGKNTGIHLSQMIALSAQPFSTASM